MSHAEYVAATKTISLSIISVTYNVVWSRQYRTVMWISLRHVDVATTYKSLIRGR